MFKRITKLVLFFLLLWLPHAQAAITISSVRIWPAQDYTRLTLESKHQVCLAGYLESLRTQAHDVYAQTLRGMLGEKDHAWLGALLVIRTTYDDDLFVRCLDAFEKGWIGVSVRESPSSI